MASDWEELTSDRIGEIRDAAEKVVPLLERIAVALEKLADSVPERLCHDCGHPRRVHRDLTQDCFHSSRCQCTKFV